MTETLQRALEQKQKTAAQGVKTGTRSADTPHAQLTPGGVVPGVYYARSPPDELKLLSEEDLKNFGFGSRWTIHRLVGKSEFPPADFLYPKRWMRSTIEEHLKRIKLAKKRRAREFLGGQKSCISEVEPF